LRYARTGIWVITAAMTSLWSAAVFVQAFLGRSRAASNSVVLSHQTPSGWNPEVCLKVEVSDLLYAQAVVT
jgi:hypothetical protein